MILSGQTPTTPDCSWHYLIKILDFGNIQVVRTMTFMIFRIFMIN